NATQAEQLRIGAQFRVDAETDTVEIAVDSRRMLPPLKTSGGLQGRQHTPTIDGNFDRISFGIDPELGTDAQL
ncbi:hypothetical protein QCD79_33970, partial [Pseudomonas quasicaspiana]|nr:hypothetical protein [Pseudomonas quasicaspiana]